MLALLERYSQISTKMVPGAVKGGEHTIELTDSKPIRIKDYKIPIEDEKWLIEEAKKHIKDGILEYSTSEWAAKATAAPKKNAAGFKVDRRFCVNYRALNKRSIKDGYFMPSLIECLNMRKAQFFSKTDLNQASGRSR